MRLSPDNILKAVREYYTKRLQMYGSTPAGVDWNSLDSQRLRFDYLLRICDISRPFSINDYGCGYGALVDHLTSKHYTFRYRGFDVCDEMISKAKELHQGLGTCEFCSDGTALGRADYTVASGIFNVKLQIPAKDWEEYVLRTLREIAHFSAKGFAFNALTKYSDPDRMRSDLYYADPAFFFDYCVRNFSRYVSLFHDYPLYEFTILVNVERGTPYG